MFFRIIAIALLSSVSLFAGVKEVNQSSFSQEVSQGLVLVDFYGKWCGPCKRLGPTLEKVADTMQGKVKIIKVDIDQSKNLANSYGVEAVPTMILFKNGKEIDRLMGYHDQESIQKFINSHRN